MKFTLLIFSLFLSTLTYSNNFEEDLPIGRAVNQAGLQRMLTQRLAKSYLAVLTKTNMHEHLTQIELDVALFEKNYAEIKRMPLVSPRILQEIKIAEKEWAGYKQLVTTSPTLEGAQVILQQNSTVLEKCNNVVTILEKQAQKIGLHSKHHESYQSIAHLTNISGRQRMLSQRIMLYYLANRLNINDPSITVELNSAIESYSSSIEKLMGSLENTPEIDFKLVYLMDNWKKLEAICKNLDQVSDQDMNEVISMADFMLSEMNLITNMYEALIDTNIESLMLGNALNKAGRQRMLSQKMTKAYLAITLQIHTNEHKEELKQAQLLFTKSLEELKSYAPIPEIAEAIQDAEYMWKQYQVLVADTDNLEANAKKLVQQNTALLKACHNVVLMLKIYAKTKSKSTVRFDNDLINLIDMSGQQRMLSQRMVLYCIASNWMPEDNTVELELHKTIKNYSDNLNQLNSNNNNTKIIKERLNAIIKNWQLISDICAEEGKSNRVQLIDISNKLLHDMEEVTGMYESLISRLLDTEAINKAGRQRMLSQRIALDAIAINMGLDAEIHRQQLQKSIALFGTQLDELKIYTSNRNSTEAVNNLIQQWKQYKSYATGELTENKILQLVENNTDFLKACDAVVTKIMEESGVQSKIASLIQVSGKQRMLCQRITLHTLAHRKGINQANCQAILKEAINEFKGGIVFLERASINTPEMYALVDKQKTLIRRIENYTDDLENVDLFQILMTSNILLSEAESLVKLYEQLNKAAQ